MLPLIVTVTLLSQAPGLEIATQGRTDYVIAISADASPSERFGAGELADFLGQISGARFPIVETAEPPARAIVVGGLAGDAESWAMRATSSAPRASASSSPVASAEAPYADATGFSRTCWVADGGAPRGAPSPGWTAS